MEEELSVSIDNNRTLWLTEISRETFESQDLHELGSDNGLFFAIENCVEGTFDVVAKAAPGSASRALLQLVAQALAAGRPHLKIVT
jgi:hypothetical protein